MDELSIWHRLPGQSRAKMENCVKRKTHNIPPPCCGIAAARIVAAPHHTRPPHWERTSGDESPSAGRRRCFPSWLPCRRDCRVKCQKNDQGEDKSTSSLSLPHGRWLATCLATLHRMSTFRARWRVIHRVWTEGAKRKASATLSQRRWQREPYRGLRGL